MMAVGWWRQILGALVVVAALGALSWYGHERYAAGFHEATEQQAARIADEREASRQRAEVLADEMNMAAVERQKERFEHEKIVAGLRADVRRGAVVLRVPVAASSCENSSVAGGLSTETGHELMPETAVDILDVASGIRQSVLDYNAVVDTYEKARAACNGQ